MYQQLKGRLRQQGVGLVAVSKTKPAADILTLYNMGHRDFGENYVQELAEKAAQLPQDIRWHFIGHLQSNKVKIIAPFVHLIHGVDSEKLIRQIEKQGAKLQRSLSVLLQIHIAQEETKFGLLPSEASAVLAAAAQLPHVAVKGFMGMASFTSDKAKIFSEFMMVKNLYDEQKVTYPYLDTLSIGMSSDYEEATRAGSTLVRIGSALFGGRN